MTFSRAMVSRSAACLAIVLTSAVSAAHAQTAASPAVAAKSSRAPATKRFAYHRAPLAHFVYGPERSVAGTPVSGKHQTGKGSRIASLRAVNANPRKTLASAKSH